LDGVPLSLAEAEALLEASRSLTPAQRVLVLDLAYSEVKNKDAWLEARLLTQAALSQLLPMKTRLGLVKRLEGCKQRLEKDEQSRSVFQRSGQRSQQVGGTIQYLQASLLDEAGELGGAIEGYSSAQRLCRSAGLPELAEKAQDRVAHLRRVQSARLDLIPMKDLEDDRVELEARVSSLRGEILALEQRKAVINQQRQETEATFERLKQETEAFERRIHAAQVEFETFENEKEGQRRVLKDLARQRLEAEAEIDEVKRRLESIKEEEQTQLAALEKLRQEAEALFSKKEDNIRMANDATARLVIKARQVRDEYERAERETAPLRQEHERLKKEVAWMQQELDRLTPVYQEALELTQRLSALQTEVKVLEEKKTGLAG
jgi:hypothetical protein